MNTASKVTIPNIDNRLSQLQRAILEIMAARSACRPVGSYIGHLPRTGEIVDALGRARDKAGYASVSRSLFRLEQSGFINAYRSEVCVRGKGYRWALTAPRSTSTVIGGVS